MRAGRFAVAVAVMVIVLTSQVSESALDVCAGASTSGFLVSSQSDELRDLRHGDVNGDGRIDVFYRQFKLQDGAQEQRVWTVHNLESTTDIPSWDSAKAVGGLYAARGYCIGNLGSAPPPSPTGAGALDAVVLTFDEGSSLSFVHACVNNGEGEFACSVVPFADPPASRINTVLVFCILADFTGDGVVDLVAVDQTNINGLFVATGSTGGSAFGSIALPAATPATYSVADVRQIVAADANGDGDADLLITHRVGAITWALNTGSSAAPTFSLEAATVVAPEQLRGREALFADMNNDGVGDVVAVGVTDTSTELVWARSMGATPMSFAPLETIYLFSISNVASQIAVVDVDSDGWLDVVAPDQKFGRIMWLQNWHGVPGAASEWNPEIRVFMPVCPLCDDLTLADFDGDGDMDITTLITVAGKVSGGYNTLLASAFDVVKVASGVTATSARAVAWNDDFLRDLVVTSHSSTPLVTVTLESRSAELFDESVVVELAELGGSAVGVDRVVFLDSDDDSGLDIVALVAHSGGSPANSLVAVLNDGSLIPNLVTVSDGLDIVDIAVADVDGPGASPDAHPDLVLLTADGRVYSLAVPLSTGAPRRLLFDGPALLANTSSSLGVALAASANSTTTLAPHPAFALGDMDGDGAVDLICSNLGRANETFIVWGPGFGNHAATLVSPLLPVPAGLGSRGGLAVQDMDGDGDLDIVVATSQSIAWYNATAAASRSGYLGTVIDTDVVFTGEPELSVGQFDIHPGMDITLSLPGSAPTAPYNLLTWSTSSTTPSGFRAFSSKVAQDFVQLERIDLDGDAVADVVTPRFSSLVWRGYLTTYEHAVPAPSRRIIVDTQQFGFTIQAIVQAMAQTSWCVPDVVVVPPGTYTGCFLGGSRVVRHSVTLEGSGPDASAVVLDCKLTGGLFSVQDGAQLTLRSLTVRQLAARGSTLDRAAGLQARGTGSLLSLDNVVMRDCANIGTFTDTHAGDGGAVLAVDGGAVWALDSVFVDNTATGNGGAIAAVGLGSSITLSACVFEANTAVSGSGGSVYVGVAGLSNPASAVLTNVTISASSALGTDAVGGGLCLACRTSTSLPVCSMTAELTTVSVTGSTAALGFGGGIGLVGAGIAAHTHGSLVVDGNTAKIGGGVAVIQTTTLIDQAASEFGSVRTSLTIANSSSLRGNTADYGGTLCVCGGTVVVAPNGAGSSSSSSSNSSLHVWTGGNATVSGAMWYGCVPSDGASGSAPLVQIPWLDGVNATAVFGSEPTGAGGALWKSTSPVRLVRVAGTSSGSGSTSGGGGVGTLPSGSLLDDVVLQVLDGFGQVVLDGLLQALVRVDGAPASSFVVGDGTAQVSLDGAGQISLASTTVRGEASALESPQLLNISVSLVSAPWVVSHVAVQVTACPPGQGATVEDVRYVSCKTCAAGTYSGSSGTLPCLTCEGFSLAEGALDCPACPVGTSPDVSGAAVANGTVECVCNPGFYREDGVCTACPANGLCQGGAAWPQALEGYFDVSGEPGTTTPVFARCPRPSSCVGNNQCLSGFTGYMCGSCVDNHYRSQSGVCTACPSSSAILFPVILLFVVCLTAASVLLLGYITRTEDRPATMLQRRVSRIPVSLSMGLLFAQLVATFGAAEYSWPSEASTALSLFSFSNVDLNLFVNECSMQNYTVKYVLTLMFPLFLMGVFVLAIAVYVRTPGGAHLTVGDGVRAAFVSAGPLLYFPFARSTLVFFDCVKLPDGKYYMDASLSTRCFDASWWGSSLVALLGVVVYVIGIPCGVAALLVAARDSLMEPHTLAVLGPVYKKYRHASYLFEIVQMAKRLCVAVASLFLSGTPTLQIVLLLGVLGSFAVLLSKKSPYFLPVYNELELQLSLILIAILAFGFAFLSGALSHGERVLFVVLTISSLLISLGLIIRASVIEITLLRKVRSDPFDPSLRNIRESRLIRMLQHDLEDWEEPSILKTALQGIVAAGVASSAGPDDADGIELVKM